MSLTLAIAPASGAPADSGATEVAPYWYRMYGRLFKSDFALPIGQELSTTGARADCEFVRAESGQRPPEPDAAPIAGLACDKPCHNGRMVTLVHRSAAGSWFWQEAAGTCFVHPDNRRVDVYLEPGFDAGALGLMLLGQVATLVLHKQGWPSLHASALLVGDRAVSFVGLPGQGKSTMAANFLVRGGVLLTDDVLPLQVIDGIVHGVPSLPMMKVWGQTVQRTFRIGDELPDLSRRLNKKLLTVDGRFPFATAPSRLAGVFLLQRYDAEAVGRTDIGIEVLSKQEALRLLLSNMSNRAYLLPDENASVLPLFSRLTAQASVGIISYPNGFDRQEPVYDEIYARVAALVETR